jgi:hypothetical protein
MLACSTIPSQDSPDNAFENHKLRAPLDKLQYLGFCHELLYVKKRISHEQDVTVNCDHIVERLASSAC